MRGREVTCLNLAGTSNIAEAAFETSGFGAKAGKRRGRGRNRLGKT